MSALSVPPCPQVSPPFPSSTHTLVDGISQAGYALTYIAGRIVMVTGAFFYRSFNLLTAETINAAFSLITWSSGNEPKLAILRQKVSPEIQQAAGVISHIISDYLSRHLNEAHTIPHHMRPEWLRAHYDDTWGYSGKACAMRTLFNRKQDVMRELIELNLLKQFITFTERLTKKENAAPQLLSTLLQEHLEALAQHLEHPENSSFHEASFHANLIAFLFPHGEQDLEVPGPEWLTSTLQNYSWDLIRTEIMPCITQAVVQHISAPSTQVALYEQAALKLQHVVQVGVDIPPAATSSPECPPRLSKAACRVSHACLQAFSPEHLSLARPFLTPEIFSKELGSRILPTLRSLPAEPLLREAITKGLPAINPGGAWKDKEGSNIFHRAPYKLAVLEQEYLAMQQSDTLAHGEAKKRIDLILSTLGKKHAGLEKLIHSAIESPAPVTTPQPPKGLFGNMLSSIKNRAVSFFGPAFAAGLIQKISLQTFQKLSEAPHDRLLPVMMGKSLEILRKLNI